MKQASVSVDGVAVGAIANGLAILFCAEDGDAEADADLFAHKIASMRISEDGDGRMKRSLLDVGGAALVVASSL